MIRCPMAVSYTHLDVYKRQVLCCASDEYHPDTEFETLVQMPSPVEDLWHPLAYINGCLLYTSIGLPEAIDYQGAV